MRIFVLSTRAKLYSTRRLIEEAEAAGHHVRRVNHTRCSVLLGDGSPQIIYDGENIINGVDAIIPRIGATVSQHGAGVVKEFEMHGVSTTARALGILRARDKVRTLQIMTRKKVPIPKTLFSINPDTINEQIEYLGGPPVIIKLQSGTQGMGVILADSRQSAKSIIDTFYSMNTPILLQQFIVESGGCDIRAFVVGDRVVAAMQRQSVKGDFRSNIHRGGSAQSIELTDEEKDIAIKSTQVLGLPVAGVDIIRSHHGPLLIEVNASPGLKGIEEASGVNVAAAIINLLEGENKDA